MQLETVAPQSIEEDVVSTDSNTGPRREVCFAHKVGWSSHRRWCSNWGLCSKFSQKEFAPERGLSQTTLVKLSTNRKLVIWSE
jgi:hypothetical protein